MQEASLEQLNEVAVEESVAELSHVRGRALVQLLACIDSM